MEAPKRLVQFSAQGLNIESEQNMNLDTVSDKHLHELEQLTQELLQVMRRAKLLDEPIAKSLRLLNAQAEQARCKRFDEVNPEFQGY
ncbi:MAG: hypothetical protein IT320_12535 [Anaerolineae bacterium]|nr:hypothetical protein [Anaerolineae bacterium]